MDDAANFLRATPGPPVDTSEDAVRLLADLVAEASGLLARSGAGKAAPDAFELAGFERRRAYVLTRCGDLWPEFAERAEVARQAWEDSERAASVAAVDIARGARST